MSSFTPAERGMSIRMPSTANFLIDSTDRDETRYPSASDFQIVSQNSLFNGFFTRLAVAECVVDWCVDNISAAADNNIFTVTVSSTNYSVTLPDGQYTVAQALDTLVAELNALPVPGVTFSVGGVAGASGAKTLSGTAAFTVVATNLSIELNIASGVSGTDFPVNCPLLLPYTYIDFVCPQLTYCQDLKDNTTNPVKRDVLYRWYFAWDTPAPLDTYGYPINQGYQRFIQRRYLNFPKQIRWDNIQPIGNLAFQVYTSQGTQLSIAEGAGEFEWKMSILVSEV